ncbi:unnamed protein product [Mycena citricolor]|uniref:tripeptidyl-peptidase II n=1 Tax=Mycena citricolor TaxID=2018698 RepID=A0AAD2H0A4_9AGAR|nr:unnamed protein product [Mycena citricolor]
MVASAFIYGLSLPLYLSLVAGFPLFSKPSPRAAVEVRARSEGVPVGFASLGAAPSSQSIKLRIALVSSNTSGLEQTLLDVSDPSSPNYGQHLTKDQVNAFLAPTSEALTTVKSWLTKNNVQGFVSEGAGDWIAMTVPISQANTLLSADYQTFLHTDSNATYARTLAYTLPAHVAPFIAHVHPTYSFNNPANAGPILSVPGPTNGTLASRAILGAKPSFSSRRAAVNPRCANGISPACISQLYGVPQTPATQKSNSIAVSGFIGQFAQTSDLTSFLQQARPDVSAKTTFALQTLDGGQNLQGAQNAGVEANLDIQYTVGVATGVPVTFVSVGQNNQDGVLGGFLDIVNFLNAETKVPQVLTTSYGDNEADIPAALATKLCSAYTALGARGTSILFASGDGGVSGSRVTNTCTTFQPTFPAGCPFITAVGSVGGIAPETASTFSSGGFSNVFAAPAYQKAAVSKYLGQLGKKNAGLFKATGRAYPDISAQGERVAIVSSGQVQPVDGTSCSSPIFASVVGLINDQLAAAGKPPLGFLNPFLYKNAAALNDITTGNNVGCNSNGFPALAGWDPVTGLGTPNFAALKAAAGV